jgi:RNA polymerase sigma factor (sigma-70 family)
LNQELLQKGYRYALSFTDNRPDAEDLVHDAWLQVYRKYGPLTNKYLLYRAIHNLYIDHYRKQKPFKFEPLDEHPELAAEQADVLLEDVTKEEVQSALALLRPEERQAIFLNYYEGRSASEIARLNNMPRSSVLSLLLRGKQKMAKALRALALVQNRKVVIKKEPQ